MSNDTEKSEHGKKIAAGKLLSKFIREILNETHDDPLIKARGEDAMMVTKAEAIARYVVKSALGYIEQEEVWKNGQMVGVRDIIHKPDKSFIHLVWDRMEGRVGQADAKGGSDKASLADKVSEQGKKRLGQIAKSSLTSKE
ncbi:hypothetical protein KAR91_43770 [Candidatus Pacearchaeota archaeon]|nr:hypothetical protein [Candidatus Pacearchaeota archaeon]